MKRKVIIVSEAEKNTEVDEKQGREPSSDSSNITLLKMIQVPSRVLRAGPSPSTG